MSAPLSKDDIVGDIEIVDNTGKVIKKVDLVIKDDVEKHSFFSLFIKMYKNIINSYGLTPKLNIFGDYQAVLKEQSDNEKLVKVLK